MATGPGGGFSLSSLLDQYDSGTRPGATANGRDGDPRRIGDIRRDDDPPRVRKDRPVPIGVPGKSITDSKSSTSSPLNTFTPPISKALDATQTGDKRKLEENGNGAPSKKSRFEGMTREQKVAEVKRLKALKAAREAAKTNGASGKDGNASGSAPSNPNSPLTAEAPKKLPKPAKGSYAEIMERAKQIQATTSQPAKIVHKDHKVEKKKIAGKSEKPDPTAKKPVATSSKPLNGKASASGSSSLRQSPTKKPAGRLPDPKRSEPVKPAEKPKPKAPTIEWKGTARPSATATATATAVKAPPPKSTTRLPERERERERERDRDRDRDRDYYRERSRSWERERERSRYRSPPKKYRYVESDEDDYYSDSDDMEATGIDILEEEEFSRKTGFREDLEAEKLEKELAMKKAKKKAQFGRR